MGKGLPRSLSRGKAHAQAITKIKVPFTVSISVLAVTTAIGWGTVVIGGLPEGQLKIMGTAINVQFAGPTTGDLVDTWEGDFSIGSTATTDLTLDSTDVDFIASTATGAATAELSPVVDAINGVDHVIDNTAADKELNLNLIIDAADITDAATVILEATGYIEVTLITLLDD
jgi:hypothetical protein